MKAIVLAAGYATRLRPLTDTMAEGAAAGRRPPDDRLDPRPHRRGGRGSTRSTSSRTPFKAPSFERWAAAGRTSTVHDDGTTSNEDRLGAIGDIRFVVERGRASTTTCSSSPATTCSGSRSRTTSTGGAARASRARWPSTTSARSSWRGSTGSSSSRRTTASSASSRSPRIRPRRSPRPRRTSTTASTCRSSPRYLDEGNQPDQPGRLIAWLHTREPVYGYVFEDEWLDIGDPAQLLEADNRLRAPQRAPGARRVRARLTHFRRNASQTRHTFAASVDGDARTAPRRRSCRAAASSAGCRAIELCDGCRERPDAGAARRSARRCGAPTAWPVARCRECAGRRLAFAQARAARALRRRRRGRSSAPGRSAGCAGSRRSRPSVVAEVARRGPSVDALDVRAARRRPQPQARPPSRPSGSRASSGARWELPVEPLLGRAREVKQQRGLSLAERRRNVARRVPGGARPAARVSA